jgi:hypothetical protein
MTQREPNGGLLRVALLANDGKTPLLVYTRICLPMFLKVGKLETTAIDLLADARVKSQDHKAVGPSLTAALGEVVVQRLITGNVTVDQQVVGLEYLGYYV